MKYLDEVASKLLRARIDLMIAGPNTVPDFVTDPVDREMIRRGRARVVPTISQSFVTDEWIAGEGPDCDGWEIRDNGRTEAERLLDQQTRLEIAAGIQAVEKAEVEMQAARLKAKVSSHGQREATRQKPDAVAYAWQHYDAQTGKKSKCLAAEAAHDKFPAVAVSTIRRAIQGKR